jgi:hypothetical protein
MIRPVQKHIIPVTDRDVSIIEMVFDYGGCTAEQLRRRYFSSPGARSACYGRLSWLTRCSFLTALRLPSQTGRGSGKLFLTVGPKASAILGTRRRLRTQAPAILAHHLAIGDVRLAVELAVEVSPIFAGVEWTSEHELRRSPINVQGPGSDKTPAPVPDGGLTLTLMDGTSQRLLVEVDRGTIPRRMKTRLAEYLASGRDHPVPVLWVVPDSRRQAALVRWCLEEAATCSADPTIFWVSQQARVSEASILDDPIWQVAGGPDGVSIAGLAGDESVRVPAPVTRGGIVT